MSTNVQKYASNRHFACKKLAALKMNAAPEKRRAPVPEPFVHFGYLRVLQQRRAQLVAGEGGEVGGGDVEDSLGARLAFL